jgi:2-oxoglutarate ferredoxin oxidoreductase subunit delta
VSAGDYKVEIDHKWCKKCGICAAFCPKKVFTFKAGSVPDITAEDQCIGCNLCEQRCPDFAVKVGGKKHES